MYSKGESTRAEQEMTTENYGDLLKNVGQYHKKHLNRFFSEEAQDTRHQHSTTQDGGLGKTESLIGDGGDPLSPGSSIVTENVTKAWTQPRTSQQLHERIH